MDEVRATTDGTGDVAGRLGDIETRAARIMRVRRWTVLPLAVALGLIGGVAGATTHDHPGRADDTGSIVGVIVGVVVGLAVVVAVLSFLKHRRPARFSAWREPPLTAGLPRQQRRSVLRDLRRGTPNDDPVLREVEERTVRRVFRIQSRRSVLVFPLLALVMVLNVLLPDRTTFGRWYFGVFAVLMLVFSIIAVRRRRQFARFPLTSAEPVGPIEWSTGYSGHHLDARGGTDWPHQPRP